jgi:GTP-binding protein
VDRILPQALKLAEVRARLIQNDRVNEVLREIVQANPPPASKGRGPTMIHSGAQVDVRPPTFAVFTNRPENLEGHYERFLRNQLKERLGLAGTPVRVVVRKRKGAAKE